MLQSNFLYYTLQFCIVIIPIGLNCQSGNVTVLGSHSNENIVSSRDYKKTLNKLVWFYHQVRILGCQNQPFKKGSTSFLLSKILVQSLKLFIICSQFQKWSEKPAISSFRVCVAEQGGIHVQGIFQNSMVTVAHNNLGEPPQHSNSSIE